MEQAAYSFALTMMHSIWQMALLLLVYGVATTLLKKTPPIAKRNLLFLLLGTQLLTSALSFYILYNHPFEDFSKSIPQVLNSFIASQNWLQTYAELMCWMYLLVVVYKLVRTAVYFNHFTNRYKSSQIKPSIDIRLFTQSKATHFGIHHKVAIWCSNSIQSPVTFGFFKPVILLPLALVNRLSMEQTESLIIHELTHIKQHDYFYNWLLIITEALYFFNPFVRIIVNKIKLEREKNCDLQVLHFNYPAIGYAETLLETARLQTIAHSLEMAAVKNKAELWKRIQFFTNSRNLEFKPGGRFSFATAGLFVFILFNSFLAGYFLRNQSPGLTVTDNAAFIAMPANEWNKSFFNDPATNAKLPTVATLSLAKKENTSLSQNSNKTKQQHKKNKEVFSTEEENNLMLTPVLLKEPSIPFSNDIIINEETSSGKTITKYYQLRTINGEYLMEPLWMTAEIIPLKDSNRKYIKDSSFSRIIPAVQ